MNLVLGLAASLLGLAADRVTMLHARVLPLRPQPLVLARALIGQAGAFLLWDGTGRSASYLGCHPLGHSETLDPEPDAEPTQRGDLGKVPRWVGLLPYECMRYLEQTGGVRPTDSRPPPHLLRPSWWRFGAVAQVHRDVRVVGDDREAVDELSSLLMRGGGPLAASLTPAQAPEPVSRHRDRILRALELIRAGEIYQVNLARRLQVLVQGHPISLLESLGARSRFAYGAAMRFGDLDVVSTSPELFLRTTLSGRLYTAPIKGTRPRGQDADGDRSQLETLSGSEKEAAELTMILDVERNDLGRVARVGSVRLLRPPRVTTHPTLHHRDALLGAVLRAECGLDELLRVMLPSGSVTGAPKVRAMQVIAELEAERRGLYTGAFGMLSYERELTLAMAIRTLTVQGGVGHYFAGGGIVADSDPEAEIQETGWKALQLAPGVA